MSSRREFITLLGGVAAWPRGVLAQATSRRAMIAWVWSSSQSNFDEYVRTGKFVPPFLKGMREFGHTEGRDFDMVHGFANGEYDRMPKVAAELAELNPNVFIAPATALAVAPDRLSGIIKTDYDRWIAIIREAGIRPISERPFGGWRAPRADEVTE